MIFIVKKIPEEIEDLVMSLSKSVEELTTELELLRRDVDELKRKIK